MPDTGSPLFLEKMALDGERLASHKFNANMDIINDWVPDQTSLVQSSAVLSPVDITNGTKPFTQAAYEAWPTIAQFPSGKILLFYNHGTDDGSVDSVIRVRTSSGFGAPWSSAATEVSEASVGSNLGGGGITPSGRAIILYGRASGIGSGGLTMNRIYSDSEGAPGTWSAPATISHGSETGYFVPYGAIVSVDENKLMMSWYGQTGGTNTAYVSTSSDDGDTWSSPITIATGINECSLAYLGERKIIAICRRADSSISHQFYSSDNGATWTDQGQIAFPQPDNGATFSQVAAKPVFLTTFHDLVGRRMVAAYFFNPGTPVQLYVSYGYASDVDAGPSSWLLTKWIYAPPTDGSGSIGHYPHVFHHVKGGFAFGAHNYYHAGGSPYSDIMLFQVNNVFSPSQIVRGNVRVNGGTVTDLISPPLLEILQTWNQGGAGSTLHGIKLTITDTASGSASKLIEIILGVASKLALDKNGLLTTNRMKVSTAGNGLILTSPDGLTTKEVTINNAGAIALL